MSTLFKSMGAQLLVPAGAALLLAGCEPVAYVEVPPPATVQAPPPVYYAETPPPPPQAPAANPLDQLMAPVALYPDPLISILLPASTFPSEIAAAGAFLNGGGDPGQVDAQPWEPSVRSLAHYPDVVKWMAGNGPWTQAVGAAFVSQPAEVMKAIQRLRELARAAGTLTNTPQQQVVVQGSFVEIEPAQPDVIYVPRYDPAIVFVDQPYYGYHGPYFSYGPGYQAGAWLTFGPDWGGGGVLIVGTGYWHGGGGWWHPHGEGPGPGFHGGPGGANVNVNVNVSVHAWTYPAGRPAPRAPAGWQHQAQVVHPQLVAGIPPRPPQAAFRNIRTQGAGAVAVVAANPAAFKGSPINGSIIARTASPQAARGTNPGQPARPQAPSAVPARPAQAAAPVPNPAPAGRQAATEAPAANGANARTPAAAQASAAGAKAVPKKKPKKKPVPAEVKPKEERPAQ